MTINDYEKLSESDRLKQEFLRQQFEQKITEYPSTILNRIKADNIYFEGDSKKGYHLRPIFRDYTDRQEWQALQDKFDEKTIDTLVNILKQLAEIEIPARIDAKEIKTSETDHAGGGEEEEVYIGDKEYFNHCHNYVFHVAATKWLLKHGLYYDIDKLNIGFDVEEYAIIIPVDEIHYKKYSIR